MCFGKKDQYDVGQPPRPAPLPSYQQPIYSNMPQKVPPYSQQPSRPSGADFGPPSGPGPSASKKPGTVDDGFAPPGLPPSASSRLVPADDDYAKPPPGPPPPQSEMSKPLQDWEIAVPDTSLFPPPPNIFSGWERSPTNNATEAQAEAGEQWCAQHPLTRPITLDAAALDSLRAHNIQLMRPAVNFRGTLEWVTKGVWVGRTDKNSGDSCIIGYPPLYAVTEHSPLATDRAKTVYYEVVIKQDSRPEETSLALGFTALPYPAFRLPGWHRGSLAVHGDDGHKYINDEWGGKDFAQPFRRGDTYGIGMTFTPAHGKIEVNIFLTCNGSLTGQWDLHEETDQEQDLPVTGLEGLHDLSCAVGTFNKVSFEVVFDPARWAYKGVPP